jgi:hypothetical protein
VIEPQRIHIGGHAGHVQPCSFRIGLVEHSITQPPRVAFTQSC